MSAVEVSPGTGTAVTWHPVCPLADLVPDRGVAAIVAGVQVAVFLLAPGVGEPAAIHAIGHHDPCSGANVLARGLVGSTGGRPYVASPLHKQRFDLLTGECLDAPVSVPTFAARLRDDRVEVAVPAG